MTAHFDQRDVEHCSARTHHSNGVVNGCRRSPAQLIWMFDGLCYWYCEDHAEKATELYGDAVVMAP